MSVCVPVTGIMLPSDNSWYIMNQGTGKRLDGNHVVPVPLSATNRTIIWSIPNPIPGVQVQGNVLISSVTGHITVRGTIINGFCDGRNRWFDITFSVRGDAVPVGRETFIAEGHFDMATGEWTAVEYDENGQPTDIAVPLNAVVGRTNT